MKPIIQLLFHGGLGNQLFQYCFYKQNFFNKDHKIKFLSNNDHWLKKNNSNIDKLLNIKISKLKNNFQSKAFNLLQKKIIFKEINDLNYKNINKNFSRVFINGYFQSKNCHNRYYEKLSKEIYENNMKKIISSKIANYCSLAIRRSDFVKLGWSLNLSYYFESLKKLKINKKNKIKIVSEDIEFANLFSYKLKKMGYNSEVLKNKSNIQDKSINDFTNLINSKNLIIANSSFSWWAANIRAVAGFDNRKICCPKLWFPKTYISHLNVQPFIPKNWKIINNTF